MKEYLVILVPKKELPEDESMTTVLRIRMTTMAESNKDARKNCEKLCKAHGMFMMKAQYSRCVEEEQS